jgi:hypothetical protein
MLQSRGPHNSLTRIESRLSPAFLSDVVSRHQVGTNAFLTNFRGKTLFALR